MDKKLNSYIAHAFCESDNLNSSYLHKCRIFFLILSIWLGKRWKNASSEPNLVNRVAGESGANTRMALRNVMPAIILTSFEHRTFAHLKSHQT